MDKDIKSSALRRGGLFNTLRLQAAHNSLHSEEMAEK